LPCTPIHGILAAQSAYRSASYLAKHALGWPGVIPVATSLQRHSPPEGPTPLAVRIIIRLQEVLIAAEV
jgi:hypothetical protein